MTRYQVKLRGMRTTVNSVSEYIRPGCPELVSYDIAVQKIYCSANSYLRFLLLLTFWGWYLRWVFRRSCGSLRFTWFRLDLSRYLF